MFNKRETKYPMPVQEPLVRNKNFNEVCLGYDAETAKLEAQRCLHCKNSPCVNGCPVSIMIPDFIAAIAAGEFGEAYEVISQNSMLPAVCGRVCPQERQCEKLCVRAIKGEAVAIGRLERFAADYHAIHAGKTERPASNGHKVAVVGSGPAGLACAGDLARLGYEVTVFEALHEAGGVLAYGIPAFRLPKEIVRREVENLMELGVKFEMNSVVGRLYTVEELKESGFEAIFLGTGAGLPRFMGIKGENAKGVFSANEYLTRANLMRAYEEDSKTPVYRGKNVAVVGGGNVAMDAARTAKRLGAEKVFIVYRRGKEELPARGEEIEHAMEEEVEFRLLTDPVEILTDAENNVVAMKCVETVLGEPDASGRRKPVAKAGSEFEIAVDCVIMALGTSPNPLVKQTTVGLETNARGGIVADENGKTSLDGVFAGGDAVTGSATVILAMGAGKRVARSIDEYIRNKIS